MNEDWIEFDDGPTQVRDGIYASINPFGDITLNRYAFEELKGPEAVVLLYAPNSDKIGLRPVSPLMPNAFRLKPKGARGHRVIRAKRFLKKHDLRIDGTVRFLSPVIEGGILILNLRSMQTVARKVTGTRRR